MDGESKTEEKELPESFSVEQNLRRAVQLATSLVSLSHSVKHFSGKWQSIRGKVDELLSGLSAIECCDSRDGSPSLSAVIQAIMATLDECHGLVRRCIGLSYSGKLQMKSDLNVVSSKLEGHVRSLSDAYDFGLLSNGAAIVVPRPDRLLASRDDMRFFLRDLLSRLKIGCADMRKQTLIAFNEAIQENDKYAKIATEMDGFVPLLVNFLDSPEMQIEEEAARAVSLIARERKHRGVLVGAGIVPPLIRVLESGTKPGREFAARCLQMMTENADNVWSVSAHGGVTVLLKVCSKYDSSSKMIGLACGILKNLIGVEEIKRFMLDEGAISVIIGLIRSQDEASQISAMDLLQAMASEDDESIRQMVVKQGIIYLLVRFLDPNSSFLIKTREMALRAISSLCSSSSRTYLNMLMDYGFLDYILCFLSSGEASLQGLALKASFWLCGTSEEARKAMGEAGFMTQLVKFLDSASSEVRKMASESISRMVLIPRNQKKFVEDDQNVRLILNCLKSGDANSGNRKLLLSILLSLASNGTARKKIMHSGHMESIAKLSEEEDPDAKAIVRKLSSGRFRNLLSGIWHF